MPQPFPALYGSYPNELLQKADTDTYGTEFMDYILAIKTINNLDEALAHIEKYGSGHSECIINKQCRNR